MALDYFHAIVYDSRAVASIRKNISFQRLGDLDTLEEIYPFKKEMNSLIFKLIKDQDSRFGIDISGSLHKYYNCIRYNKNQNFDDFTFALQSEALDMLSKRIGCDLRHILIISFEFGVNINCGFPANDLISKIHYFDRTKIPNREEYKNSGKQITFKADSYLIKIYNKSQEAQLFKNQGLNDVNDLIRLEFKSKDKDYTKSVGICSLQDFKNQNKVEVLYTLMKSKWANIFMVNSKLMPDKISKEDQAWFARCITLNYFNDPNKENFKNPATRNNHYNKCIKILDKYNYRSEYFELTKLIEYKCNFLMSTENDLVEIVMDNIYLKLLNAPKVTQTLLKETIETLISNGSVEMITKLINQAIERLQRAGHIEIIQSNPISYRVI